LAKYRTLDKEVKTITGELTNYKIAIEKGRNDLLKLYNVILIAIRLSYF